MANVNEFMLGEFVKAGNLYGQIVAIDKHNIGVYIFDNVKRHNLQFTPSANVKYLDNKAPTGEHCWWYTPDDIKHCVTENDAKKEFEGFHLGDRAKTSYGTGIVVAFDKNGWLGIALDKETGYAHRFGGIFDRAHDDTFVSASNFMPIDGRYATWAKPKLCELVSRPDYGHKDKPVSYVINKRYPKIVITTDGHETRCVKYNPDGTKDEAVAACHPDDKFDFETGAKLAFSRMYDLSDANANPDIVDGDYICIRNVGGGFTVGKIYHFDNGYTFDNDGDKRPMCGCPLVKSQLNGYGFIPLVK